jgi:hypothetical protein
MSRFLRLLCAFFLLIACHKHQEQPGFKPIDTINNISVSIGGNQGWIITPGNKLSLLQFNNFTDLPGYPGAFSAQYIGWWYSELYNNPVEFGQAKRYYLTYLGSEPLVNAQNISYRTEGYVSYSPDPALLNKPIFEARSVTDSSLFKTFVLADTGSIWCWYYDSSKAKYTGLSSPTNVSNDSLTRVFLYYLSATVFDSTYFYFNDSF